MKEQKEYPEYPMGLKPLRKFRCCECGSRVNIFGADDRRMRYCCRMCKQANYRMQKYLKGRKQRNEVRRVRTS